MQRCRLYLLLVLIAAANCQAPPNSASVIEQQASTAPAPDPATLAEHASAEPSVKPGINAEYANTDVATWVERFESESREIFRERERIVQTVALRPGMVVADIGAGTGLFTEPLARAVGPKGKVIAVDIVPSFLEHIRQRAAAAGLSNVSTVLCKEDSVELPPASIDLAFMCDTYHHFEYPKRTLQSIHRALQPNGQLIVIEFKRIAGVSRPWVLEHVRAGQDEVTAEIRAAGFELVSQGSEAPYLEENYLLRFRKSGR